MKHAEEVMNGAAERLRNKVLKGQPDQIDDILRKILHVCLSQLMGPGKREGTHPN